MLDCISGHVDFINQPTFLTQFFNVTHAVRAVTEKHRCFEHANKDESK
jgi:hypothetical protein